MHVVVCTWIRVCSVYLCMVWYVRACVRESLSGRGDDGCKALSVPLNCVGGVCSVAYPAAEAELGVLRGVVLDLEATIP